MRKHFPLLLMLFVALLGCRVNKPYVNPEPLALTPAAQAISDYSAQETWLLGYFTRKQMTWEPHNKWFMSGYDNYTPDTEAMNKLISLGKDDLSIKIVMGSWCPDSRREVPRFMRILDIWQFPAEKITFIGVDDAKLSPVGEYVQLNIQRVPTFIIYKKNIEAGRIIENPVTSLEQDVVNILNK